MKTRNKALAAATTLFALSATVLSAHAEGLYVGGSLGPSHYKGDTIGGSATSDHGDTGLKVYGGYGILPFLSVEAGYANLGKFKSPAADLRASGLFADVVGTVPLGAGFSALGSIGLFNGKLASSTAGSDRGTSYKLGAGVQYEFDKNIGVRGEWERYRFDALATKASTDIYTVGVNYRF